MTLNLIFNSKEEAQNAHEVLCKNYVGGVKLINLIVLSIQLPDDDRAFIDIETIPGLTAIFS
jgi:hypothetical protein